MRKLMHHWRIAAILVAGLAVGSTGCSDSPNQSANLLTNPGTAKVSADAVKQIYAPLEIGKGARPILELVGTEPTTTGTTLIPATRFHLKIPEWSRYFWMYHITSGPNQSKYYDTSTGDVWVHITEGPWTTYYTPEPINIPPGDPLHIVRGPDVTRIFKGWHISQGVYASAYYEPIDSTVWVHIPSGFDASLYKPAGSVHITSGTNASLYQQVTPQPTLPSDDVPDYTLN